MELMVVNWIFKYVNMRRSHADIMEKLKPIEADSPQRFKIFYDRIYCLLISLKPGQKLLVDDCCTARSRELFLDIVELCIIEERAHADVALGGLLELNDDETMIIRGEALLSIL